MNMTKWDRRYMEMAELVASWSKDPSTRVGAVIVSPDNHVVSVGFNGFPRGIEDNDRLNQRGTKYMNIVHAEMNALIHADRSVDGCILYTYPFQAMFTVCCMYYTEWDQKNCHKKVVKSAAQVV